MSKFRLAAAALMLALAACATSEASVEVAFQTARLGANAYEDPSIPLCPAQPVCKDIAIVQKIHDASEAAYSALLVARKQQSGDSVAAAQQAVTAFQAVINLPEVQDVITKKK